MKILCKPLFIKRNADGRLQPVDRNLIQAENFAATSKNILHRMIVRVGEISHIISVYNIASSVKNHRLYQDFSAVKNRLAAHQFVCWIAGGAVRDFCLGREVNEFDLVTDATTEALKILFPEAVLVGESFGVLKLPLSEGEFFDLATFREESDYRDGRRPSHVQASTPVADSLRRDFSVNAMFWNDQAGVIVDLRGGLADLELQRLVCVGEASVRFTEDYLRILRLARFAAQLNFKIEEKTLSAALAEKSRIKKVSGERIWSELRKIEKSGSLQKAMQIQLFRELLSEILGMEIRDVQSPAQSLMLFIWKLDPKTDLSTALKERLKVSNAELQIYTAIKFLMDKKELLGPAELAYEIEKSALLKSEFSHLVSVGIIEAGLDQSIKKILEDHSEILITAKELVDLIPKNFIGEELKNIRISQFNGGHKTKGDVLHYLKKKYAN